MPLFDEMLLQRLQHKEAKTVEILADYLAKIIAKSADSNLPELSRSLQSVISPAIAREIADNKEKMVDALYPIMGSMISKYVSNAIAEMMENINNKIEDGLSFERYKRKIKAKLTGVSESELLLEEAADAKIESLFIIQKDTGLLIAKAHLASKEIDDPHMVASMASAIREFVNDWVENNANPSEVQLLSYGNATLYIESAGSVYLIAFLDAEPDYEQRAKIDTFFATLVNKYSNFFQRFDGDDQEDEIQAIEEEMRAFLITQEPQRVSEGKQGRNPLKYLLWILILLLLAYGGYRAKEQYDLYQISQRFSQKTGEKVTVEKEDGHLVLKGNIGSLEGLYRLKTVLENNQNLKIENRTHAPIFLLDQKLTSLQEEHQEGHKNLEQLGQKLASLQKENRHLKQSNTTTLNRLDRISKKLASYENRLQKLQQAAHSSTQSLRRIASLANLKHNIIERLKNRFGTTSVLQPDGSLLFGGKDLFGTGKTIPNKERIPELKDAFSRYLSVLLGDPQIKPFIKQITIESYTDTTGDTKSNLKLSSKRASEIKKILLQELQKYSDSELPIISAQGMGESRPLFINGKEDKEASRRIKLKFELDEQKLIENIKKSAVTKMPI